MKPPPFEYARGDSVDQVVALLAEGPDARVLAGGQSLLPLLNLRLAGPELLIDIGRIPELQRLTVEDGVLSIGAAVIQADAAADPAVRTGWPMVAAAIDEIGHPQIRNRGTVCGSLAHNDPLAELPAVALALDASFVVRSSTGPRTIPAEDMFTGPFMTALEPTDLLVEVRFPTTPAGSGWSFREFANRDGDFATVGVATVLTVVGGAVAEARVVLFGVGQSAQRSAVLERALIGATEPAVDADLRAEFARSLDPPDDVHASAATRRDLAVGLVVESVIEAWDRARS